MKRSVFLLALLCILAFSTGSEAAEEVQALPVDPAELRGEPATPLTKGEFRALMAPPKGSSMGLVDPPSPPVGTTDGQTSKKRGRGSAPSEEFGGLSDREARHLLRASFGDELAALLANPADILAEADSVNDMLSDYAAVIDPKGPRGHALVESTSPLTSGDRLVDLSLELEGSDVVSKNPLTPVEIPSNLSDKIEFVNSGIEIEFEGLRRSSEATLLSPSGDSESQLAFYPRVSDDVDLAIAPIAEGMETFSQLRSEKSDGTLVMTVHLEDGQSLSATDEGGASVLDEEKHEILHFFTPTSVDADGMPVPTNLTVDGTTVRVEVDHRGRGFSYPILMDPIVQEYWDWWTPNQSSYSFGDWAQHQTPGSAYHLSTGCNTNPYATDSCSGSGRGLYINARPGDSVLPGQLAQWVYNVPWNEYGSTNDAYIAGANVGSWRYLRGTNTSNTHPYGYFGLYGGGDWIPNQVRVKVDSSGGGDGFTGGSTTKQFIVGMATWLSATMPAQKWRYMRLAGISMELRDGNPPAFWSQSATGVPTGWLSEDEIFVVGAIAADAGLGVKGVGALGTNPAGGWYGAEEWHAPSTSNTYVHCTGLSSNKCPRVTTGNVVIEPGELIDGKSTVAIYARDALDKITAGPSFQVKVDNSSPDVSTSGSATQGDSVGTDLQIDASDDSSSALGSGVKSIVVVIEQANGQPDQEVYREGFACNEIDGTCPQAVSRQLSLPADVVANGTAIRVLVKDQTGNVGGIGGVDEAPEWEIEPEPDEILVNLGATGAGVSSANLENCHTVKARGYDVQAKAGLGKKVILGTRCRDLIDMSQSHLRSAKIIFGLDEGDVILARGGNQTVYGNDGNDRILGGMNNDTLYGGEGYDGLFGGVGDDFLYGGKGGDRLLGGPGADKHRGDEGSDFIRGGQGTDEYSGGTSGNDVDTLSFSDAVSPGFSSDVKENAGETEPDLPTGFPAIGTEERGVNIDLTAPVPFANNGPVRLGGAKDFVCIRQANAIKSCVPNQTNGFERIVGSSFSDKIVGTASAEIILGGAGGDSIDGGGGLDSIFGGPGSDEIDGAASSFMDGGSEPVAGESNSCIGRSSDSSRTVHCSRSDQVLIPRQRTTTKVTVGKVKPNASSDSSSPKEMSLYLKGSSGADNIRAQYFANDSKVVFTKMKGSPDWPSEGKFVSGQIDTGCSVASKTKAICQINEPLGSIVVSGGPGIDYLRAVGFDETDDVFLLGGLDRDRLSGGSYGDVLVDGDTQRGGREILEAGPGDDVLIANKGVDTLKGDSGGDLLMSTSLCDGDGFYGGDGNADNSQWSQLPRPPLNEITMISDWGLVNSSAVGLDIDLSEERAGRYERGTPEDKPMCRGGGTISEVKAVERVEASGNPDKAIGDSQVNMLIGRGGPDILAGAGGSDRIVAAEGRRSWHMDHINCGGGVALWQDASSEETEEPPLNANCSRDETPLRYGGPPPPPYPEVGDVGLTSAAYLGEVDDSEAGADAAGIVNAGWESQRAMPSALYSMNESSGTEAADFLDPAEGGTYAPDPAGSGPELGLDGPMVAAQKAEAVGLDGSDDKIELTTELDPADQDAGYSVELWVNIDPTQTLEDTVLFSRGTDFAGVELYLDANGEITFESNRNAVSKKVRTFGFQPDNQWHHVVATIDSEELTLFVDAIKSQVGFDATAVPEPTPSAENVVGASSSGDFTEMEVDTVAIYDTALSYSDVLEKFSLGSDEPPVYLPLEPIDTSDSDGDTLPDEQDNCPNIINEDQSDVDADGSGDACDPQLDTDGDLVEDSADNCRLIVNSEQTDSDSNGIGDDCEEAESEPAEIDPEE